MSAIDNNMKPCIAIDFDKTICDSDYPLCGPPIQGAKEALARFWELGYLILIFSCRACHWHYDTFGGSRDVSVCDRETVKAMKAWLDEHEIPYDEIDDGSRGKAFADFYIDDKAIRFDGNWPSIVEFVSVRTKGFEVVPDEQGYDPRETYTQPDNPFWDGTDFCHHAYWRGSDTAGVIVAKALQKIAETGEHCGCFGGSEIEDAAQAILRLYKKENTNV